MKILYMSMSFDINKNSLYNNLVDCLVDRGHKVIIVSSSPEVKHDNFIEVNKNLFLLKVKTLDPFSKNKFKKGLNQVLLAKYFKRAIRKSLKNESIDLILYATPPVTLAGVVKYCKKLFNANTFLMLKDIFPQNAVDLNMIKYNSIIYKYFRRQEINYYNYSDYIGCMSKGNMSYLLKHNTFIDSSKVVEFPNSIKIVTSQNLFTNDDKTTFLFGGNLGKPQFISGLLEIIEKLKDYDKAKFLIIGDGVDKSKIISYIENVHPNNLIYKERMPSNEYDNILKRVDVGLICLDPRFTIPNMPSRFQHYLKLSKPVLAITDTNTDLHEIISEADCGWWSSAEELTTTVELIKYICQNKQLQIEKGTNGFKYLKENYDIKKNVILLEKIFSK